MSLLDKIFLKNKIPTITNSCMETIKQLNMPPKIKVIDVELNFPEEVINETRKRMDIFVKKNPKIYIDNKEFLKRK